MPDLQNSAACEQLIAQILETKRGKVVMEDSTLPLCDALELQGRLTQLSRVPGTP
jgi:hypothetical protein